MQFSNALTYKTGTKFDEADIRQFADEVLQAAQASLTICDGKIIDTAGFEWWRQLHFASLFMPDSVLAVDLRPIKKMIRKMCASYEPGFSFGAAPTATELLDLVAEMNDAVQRVRFQVRRDDDWSEYKTGEEWRESHFKYGKSTFNDNLKNKWLPKQVAEREGTMVRFRKWFLAQFDRKQA